MARKKVTVAYILNDPTRKATGKKRAMGAIKKVSELAVLCGVEACLIIVLEDGTLHVWPSLPAAMGTIDRYRSLPEVHQCKNKMDGEDYVRDRVAKMQEQLRKAERDNCQRENMLLLHDAMAGGRNNLAGLAVEQVVGVGWMTENLIKKIKDCIACRGGQSMISVKDDDQLPYAAATVSDLEYPHLQQQQWPMEVVKAGWDVDALAYNGGSSANGSSSGSVGAGGDVMQLGNIDARFPWAASGIYFPLSD